MFGTFKCAVLIVADDKGPGKGLVITNNLSDMESYLLGHFF